MITKKFLGLLTLVLAGLSAKAQDQLQNQPHYDDRMVHFGFSVGMNYYDFKVDHIANLASLEGYYSAESVVEPGYTISIISNLHLGEHFDLRFNPGFTNVVRKLDFDIIDSRTNERTMVRRQIESAFLEFPLLLKFKSQRVDNYRLYVIGGPKYSLDLASDEDIEDDRVFKLRRNEYSYQVGFGIDIYFEYFKFSPQIVGIFGISDIKVPDDTFLVEGMDRLRTRAILINFTFE